MKKKIALFIFLMMSILNIRTMYALDGSGGDTGTPGTNFGNTSNYTVSFDYGCEGISIVIKDSSGKVKARKTKYLYIDGWMNSNGSASATKLYDHLNIPYKNKQGNYTKLLEYIKEMGDISFQTGDYITIEPFGTFREKGTTCSSSNAYRVTFRSLTDSKAKVSTTNGKLYLYQQYYKFATALANAASVETTISGYSGVGSTSCNLDTGAVKYKGGGEGNYPFCGYSSSNNNYSGDPKIGYGIVVVRYSDIYKKIAYNMNGWAKRGDNDTTNPGGKRSDLDNSKPIPSNSPYQNASKNIYVGTAHSGNITMNAGSSIDRSAYIYYSYLSENGSITLPRISEINLSGYNYYNFVGWSLDQQCSNSGEFFEQGSTIKLSNFSGKTINRGWNDDTAKDKDGDYVLFACWKQPTEGYLQIKKVNSNGTLINVSSKDNEAKFQIYKGSGCVEGNKLGGLVGTGTQGTYKSEKLTVGDYSVKEINAPTKSGIEYIVDSSCHNVTITDKNTTTNPAIISVTNGVKGCEDIIKNDNSISNRIELYTKSYPNFNSLLDFNNQYNNQNPCSNRVWTPAADATCLGGGASSNYNLFTKDNLSNYTFTEQIPNTQTTAYCAERVEFHSKSTIINPSKAGQLFIKSNLEDGTAVEATLKIKCYAYNKNNELLKDVNLNLGSVDNFLKDVKLGDTNLEPSNPKNITVKIGEEYIQTIKYKFKKTYSSNGSGELIEYSNNAGTTCKNCKFLGYGKASKLNTATSNNNINFEYSYRLSDTGNYTTSKGTCSYIIEPEIVKDNKLELEFRSIQVTNPFPGKEGKQRIPGSNWNIDNKDSYLLDRPNSYGIISRTNERVDKPKYVINLSKSEIQNIRNDNKGKNYDDYNIGCIDTNTGQVCRSTYLTELQNKKVLTINYSEKRSKYCDYLKTNGKTLPDVCSRYADYKSYEWLK